MSADAELVLLFGTLHLVAIGFGVVLFVMFLRSEPVEQYRPPSDDDSDGGGGTRLPRPEPVSPRGDGIPLPDAEPSRVRFRGPGRLADHFPRPERRRTVEPARTPARTPHRTG